MDRKLNMKHMREAVIYARVSSKDQEKEGFSIPAQLKFLYDYAARNELAVVREFVDVEIHLAKEGQVISKESKSQAKLMHGIQVVIARNYIENLKEEVRKGMQEKAEQGIYPSRPPLGYQNNKVEHTIEINPRK